MPDPSLELQLIWRGTVGHLRVRDGIVSAETNYGQNGLVEVPMDRVQRWYVAPAEVDAFTVVFVAPEGSYRVLLDGRDEAVAVYALSRVLGEPTADGGA